MGVVLLFGVRVVVLLAGAAAGHLHRRFAIEVVAMEVMVEELASVVCVEGLDPEGQAILDLA